MSGRSQKLLDGTRSVRGRAMRLVRRAASFLVAFAPLAACGQSDDHAPVGQPVDVAGLTSFVVENIYCGARPRDCNYRDFEQRSWVVDLAHARITRHRCGDGGADDVTSSSLSDEQMTKLRSALANLRSRQDEIETFDGPMSALTLTTSAGTSAFSPGAVCGADPYNHIVAGWADLEAAVRGL